MSITILTGNPGHGKSYGSVKMIDEFVHSGKSIVTNVALRKDFAEQMARRHTAFGFLRPKAVEQKAELYRSRIHICEDIKEITRVRFSGKGEGRGKVVIEEAHRHMNVRGGKGDEAQQRKEIVEYASGHRHYGADVILITQAIGNIDLHIRNLYEFHAETINLRKHPFIGLFIRLIPGGQLFIRRTFWSDRNKTRAGLSIYGLSKRLANLYDTHSLEESDWPEDVIILPRGSSPNKRVAALVEVATSISSSVDEVIETNITPKERRRLRKKEKRLEERCKPPARHGSPWQVLDWISKVESIVG